MSLLGAIINLRSRGNSGSGMYRVTRAAGGAYVKGRYVAGPTALTIPDDVIEAVDITTDQLTLTAHGLETGDGPVRLTTTGTLPAGLATGTDYWVVVVDVDNIMLATSLDNAMEVVPSVIAIDISDAGTGVHTLVDVAGTTRQNYATFAITASVQPVSGLMLNYEAEGQSGDEDKIVFTSTQLRIRTETNEPDIVEVDDEEFLVTKVDKWDGPSTTHYQVTISRLEVP